MVIHLQTLQSNRTARAVSLPPMQTADYSRIVGDGESVAAALLEAINMGIYLWANPSLERTVISKTKPSGKDWHKVHATLRMPNFGPEAA